MPRKIRIRPTSIETLEVISAEALASKAKKELVDFCHDFRGGRIGYLRRQDKGWLIAQAMIGAAACGFKTA